MADDLYVRLCKRINQSGQKMPVLAEVLDFLKAIFTEEQAALVAEFPIGEHTADALASRFNRDQQELEALLGSMADEGLIFIANSNSGQRMYSVTPFVPGLIEFQFMKGEMTEEAVRRAKLVERMNSAVAATRQGFFENTAEANEKIRPGMRVLAVEEELGTDLQVASWEQISELLSHETSFAVGYCACRQEARLVGLPCSIENVPLESCVYFGKVADYMIERQFAVRHTQSQIQDLLKSCEDFGLVHIINNFIGDNIVLCNCCGCCCSFITKMKQYRGLRLLDNSNFQVSVTAEECTGCGDCIDICQLDALELQDDVVRAIELYCIGCGNCVKTCPAEVLSLIRRSDNKPRQKSESVVGLGR